jgi:hypothetical protein
MGRSHPRLPSSAPPPGYVAVTDRSPMGYARGDAEQTARHLSGEIAELQHLAAALSSDRDAEQIVRDLQLILTTAANALAHAARLRGIRETIANFEETP